jgi:hypothetical protein
MKLNLSKLFSNLAQGALTPVFWMQGLVSKKKTSKKTVASKPAGKTPVKAATATDTKNTEPQPAADKPEPKVEPAVPAEISIINAGKAEGANLADIFAAMIVTYSMPPTSKTRQALEIKLTGKVDRRLKILAGEDEIEKMMIDPAEALVKLGMRLREDEIPVSKGLADSLGENGRFSRVLNSFLPHITNDDDMDLVPSFIIALGQAAAASPVDFIRLTGVSVKLPANSPANDANAASPKPTVATPPSATSAPAAPKGPEEDDGPIPLL